MNRLNSTYRVVRRTAVTVAFGSALVATSGAGAAPYKPPFPLQSTTAQGAGAAQRYMYAGTPTGALERFRIDYTKGGTRRSGTSESSSPEWSKLAVGSRTTTGGLPSRYAPSGGT